MSLQHPFQKICIITPGRETGSILLAASGPIVCSIDIGSGKLLNQWPLQIDQNEDIISAESDHDDKNGVRPAKRRKLESAQSVSISRQTSDISEDSVEIVAERKKGERRRPKIIDSKLPKVSHLLATRDGRYVVAVTSEDKSIRVFQINSVGNLDLLSKRSLPKRLCALKLTADEATILAADKFGDAYSLPLHPSADYVPKIKTEDIKSEFTPAATELTVHTKGNRNALKQQRQQKKFKPRKEAPTFEHKLLLGHVSLLTDLAIGNGVVDGRPRPFILTADRDEHIRVSRGIPQSHVIETYCLGHTEFITNLCIPSWCPELLIAGNGEPSLRTYLWQKGEVVGVVSLSSQIQDEVKSLLLHQGRILEKLVVSGIWSIESSNSSEFGKLSNIKGLVLVALEGLPILLTYAVDLENKLVHLNTLNLPANILDISQLPTSTQIILSLDTVHQSASVKTYRTENTDHQHTIPSLQSFRLSSTSEEDSTQISWLPIKLPEILNELQEYLPEIASEDHEPQQQKHNRDGVPHEKPYSRLGEFLYGLENLRKKRDMTAEEEEEEEAEGIIMEAGDQDQDQQQERESTVLDL